MDNIERFARLFSGNTTSYGCYVPSTDKSYTKKEAITINEYSKHLNSRKSIGVVPILEDHTCFFGALDFDNHLKENGVDLIKLESKVRQLKLPLVVCRSKSGSGHVFLFCKQALPAEKIKAALNYYAKKLKGMGEENIEVFPKQKTLIPGAFGSFINLPYYGTLERDTDRPAIIKGKPASFEAFLDLAEKKAVTLSDIEIGIGIIERQAPPCIEKFIEHGLPQGKRNIGLYNYCIYAKQAFPNDWRERSITFNQTVMAVPLPYSEFNNILKSIENKDYRYKCKEEPCKSYCNAKVCVKKEYGITDEEKKKVDFKGVPIITHLKKYMTTPVKWELDVNGVTIQVSTNELMDFRLFRKAMFEKLTQIIPNMPNEDWLAMLQPIAEAAEEVDVPEEVSREGMLREKFKQFIYRTDMSVDGKDKENRLNLLSGIPVYMKEKANHLVVFKGEAFMSYLEKDRYRDLKHSEIWMAIKDLGVYKKIMRIKDNKTIRVWIYPLNEEDIQNMDELQIDDMDIKGTFDFETEF